MYMYMYYFFLARHPGHNSRHQAGRGGRGGARSGETIQMLHRVREGEGVCRLVSRV